MKKRIIAFLLVAVMLVGIIPLTAVAADNDNQTALTPDTSWYIEDKTTYYIYDASDLLGFAKLGSEGVDFAGKVIMLMADIDLNPGWSAAVSLENTVVFPEAPANVWADIVSFKGTLDGNGYTVSGIYSSDEVADNKGAYGGLFNTLDGGTVKNLRISNSFLHTAHIIDGDKYGSSQIHVGGIAGDVNTGSVLDRVYMDNTVEIWYQSDAHCMMGGAFGVANGNYTVVGFVFTGRIGNTSDELAKDYDVPGENNLCVALITGNQNSKGGSITNSLALKSGFYVKGNWLGESGNDRVAQVNKNATINCVANTRESAAWLDTRPNDYGKNFVYNESIKVNDNGGEYGSIIPKEAVDMVNGTFEHKKASSTASFDDENTYLVYTANELLTALENGGDFEGKTLRLMADIDLNPGWNAAVALEDTVVFPTAPSTVWPDVASFKGVFDGNGYTLSGIYSYKEVVNNKGAYGGLFNTLDGGTVKNLRISNSFLHTAHIIDGDKYGSSQIHVGGIAGDVNTGSVLDRVYMDNTVEIWYQSDAHCMMGGAFGVANGSYTVVGFVFTARIGNTSDELAKDYDVPGNNNLCVASITGNQNGQGGSITNSLALKSGICVKGNWWGESGSDRVSQVNKNATINCVANTRESAAWLDTRPNDYGKNFVYNESIKVNDNGGEYGSIIPKEAVDIVNGTFEHVLNQTSMFYQVSEVSNGEYSIRFLSGLDSTEAYKEVGFAITVIVNGIAYELPAEQTMTNCVYNSVWAAGKLVSAKDVGRGYEYLYASAISGITASDNVVIKIATVNVGNDGKITTGEFAYLGFSNGVGHIVAA